MINVSVRWKRIAIALENRYESAEMLDMRKTNHITHCIAIPLQKRAGEIIAFNCITYFL